MELDEVSSHSKRIMCLDIGSKRIGVALSDELKLTAQPFARIDRISFNKDIAQIISIAETESVGLIVVGLPLNMDGSSGKQVDKVKKFTEKLKEASPLEIVLWDERLSTVAVTKVLVEADMSRSKRKNIVDKLAASYILQGYLDNLQGKN